MDGCHVVAKDVDVLLLVVLAVLEGVPLPLQYREA